MEAGSATDLMNEARELGLFRAQPARDVHCVDCHARLAPSGECVNCGQLGRSEADVAKRAESDPAGTERLLRGAIARRRAYRPAKAERA